MMTVHLLTHTGMCSHTPFVGCEWVSSGGQCHKLETFCNSEIPPLGFRANFVPFGWDRLSFLWGLQFKLQVLALNRVIYWVKEITDEKERRHLACNRIVLGHAICSTLEIKRLSPDSISLQDIVVMLCFHLYFCIRSFDLLRNTFKTYNLKYIYWHFSFLNIFRVTKYLPNLFLSSEIYLYYWKTEECLHI